MAGDNLVELKKRVRLSDHIRLTVKLTRQGSEWIGCCPFHQEKTPSFTVNDAKGFFHCFGCLAHGDILDWWQKSEGLSFNDARDRLRREAGDLTTNVVRRSKPSSPSVDKDALRKQMEARSIWRESGPLRGTVGEAYLWRARCIGIEALPDCLRFHPGLLLGPRQSERCPALITAVTNSIGKLVAIQRTFLKSDGSGKAALSAPKRSLGPVGQGAVRLASAQTILGIAEGVETGLSAMELFSVPVWCVLGSNLSRVELPNSVGRVVVFADRGRAGEDAAVKARHAFRSQGRKVVVRFPDAGEDFNDALKAMRNAS
ncbi:CHC2 zinc finger domain-containing protein [Labrenzia sp. DG1229]|uniref:DUF7146 domain-containing protein n=1 Tax=Labrenzia sp. DG1229 TaxID=681847 RepID=UPI0012EBBE5D|nr:CHC2 zinc finger domain-containing protein [Labrenzia sp. DG1229]